MLLNHAYCHWWKITDYVLYALYLFESANVMLFYISKNHLTWHGYMYTEVHLLLKCREVIPGKNRSFLFQGRQDLNPTGLMITFICNHCTFNFCSGLFGGCISSDISEFWRSLFSKIHLHRLKRLFTCFKKRQWRPCWYKYALAVLIKKYLNI